MCLLLIEGSQLLRESLADGFREAGYATQAVGNVEGALASATERGHEVILLDVELPGSDWLELLQRVREEQREARVILLTPGHSVRDCVRGLNSGADDVLPKPFAFEELLARVRAVLRGPYRSSSPRIQVEDLVIDTEARRVTRAGTAVRLTAREFQLLECLAQHPGETVSQAELEDHIHGKGYYPSSNTTASAICLLRKKLGAANGERALVHTKRGQGYYLGVAEG